MNRGTTIGAEPPLTPQRGEGARRVGEGWFRGAMREALLRGILTLPPLGERVDAGRLGWGLIGLD
jgi:hypothetical protein